MSRVPPGPEHRLDGEDDGTLSDNDAVADVARIEPAGEPGQGVDDDDAIDDAGEPELVERSSVRRNMAQMASSQVVTWLLATLTAVIVPRYLGPEILGRLQLAGLPVGHRRRLHRARHHHLPPDGDLAEPA